LAENGKLYQDLGKKVALPRLTADWGGPQELAYVHGRRLFAQEKFVEACEQCSVAIAIDELYTNAYALRSASRFELGQFRTAIEDAAKAVLLDPHDSSLRAHFCRLGLDMGIPNATKGMDDAARAALADWYVRRGRARYWNDDFDKAVADFSQAIRLNPKHSDAYNKRGIAWQEKGECDKAIADYDRAIRLDPENATAYSARGFSWAVKGEFDKAIADYTKAIQLDSPLAYFIRQNLSRATWTRGIARQKAGELDTAIADFTMVIRLYPKNAWRHDTRVKAWHEKADFEKAIADYTTAMQLKADDPLYYDHLARVLATCPEEEYRNGKKAVADATRDQPTD